MGGEFALFLDCSDDVTIPAGRPLFILVDDFEGFSLQTLRTRLASNVADDRVSEILVCLMGVGTDTDVFDRFRQELFHELETSDRTVESLHVCNKEISILGVLLEHFSQSSLGRGIRKLAVGDQYIFPYLVPRLVAFLATLDDPREVWIQFLYEPQRLSLFDERTSFAYLWSGIVNSKLKELRMDLSIPDPNATVDEEELTPAQSLKTTLDVHINPSDIPTDDPSPDDKPTDISHASVRGMFAFVLKMFLACETLESFTCCGHGDMFAAVPHSIRKQVFLDYCKVMGNSQTVEDVFLPSPDAWWRDEECVKEALQMVKTNTRLVRFRTFCPEDDDESLNNLNKARREIDFWLWMNATNIDKEKLLKGTMPASLWPFLIEGIMHDDDQPGEEDQMLNIIRNRTACYQLLKQRIDLMPGGGDTSSGKRKRK